MKNLDQLENRLRSWKPRPPSAGLKDRIFRSTAEPAEASWGFWRHNGPAAAFNPLNWQWLAPAMAMFVLGMSLVGYNPRSLTQLISARPLSTEDVLAVNQQQWAAYYAPSVQSGHNTWPVATFDWTNPGPSLPTTGSTWDAAETNGLIR